jgi:hypothetical protein
MTQSYTELSTKDLAEQHRDTFTQMVDFVYKEANGEATIEECREVPSLYVEEAKMQYELLQREDFNSLDHRSNLFSHKDRMIASTIYSHPDPPFYYLSATDLVEPHIEIIRLALRIEQEVMPGREPLDTLHDKLVDYAYACTQIFLNDESFDYEEHVRELMISTPNLDSDLAMGNVSHRFWSGFA